jgi:hypothetical protein
VKRALVCLKDKRLKHSRHLKERDQRWLLLWRTFRRRHPSEEIEKTIVDALEDLKSGNPPKIALQQAYLSCCDWQLPGPFPSTAAKIPKSEVEATTVIARRNWDRDHWNMAIPIPKAQSKVCVPTPAIACRRQSMTHCPKLAIDSYARPTMESL